MGTFKLNEVGEYIPKLVTENEFLNARLESDTYGIYYSVLFHGDAETYLLQAKKAPVEDVPEWGMITESKSGKSMRFKRVKREDGTPSGGKPVADYEPSTNARWAIGMAYRAYQQVMGSPEDASGDFPFEVVKQHASELLKMFDDLKNGGSQESAGPTPSPQSIKAVKLTPATPPPIKSKLATGWDTKDMPNDLEESDE